MGNTTKIVHDLQNMRKAFYTIDKTESLTETTSRIESIIVSQPKLSI